MISWPKKAAFIIFLEAFEAISSLVSDFTAFFLTTYEYTRKTVLSTMMTAPSTIIPKSIAPKLIRFAQTSKAFININANNNDRGIVDATMRPPRQFPKSKTKTKITMRPPSNRFPITVPVVSAINSLRSRNGFMLTPSGRDC